MFDKRYRFENFEIGRSNEKAAKICKDICVDKQGHSCLWLFGPSGCGKTHLLKSVHNTLKIQDSFMNGLYISAKEMAELLYDFLGGGTNLWVNIKAYEYLIVDNVEDLAGRPKTQEAIADLISEMIADGKTVLFASLCPPNELYDLWNRFEKHCCEIKAVEIQSPDYELKEKIIEKFLLKNPFDISAEACEQLKLKSTHIPRLKSVLLSAKYLCENHGAHVNKEWVEKYGFWL